MLLIAIAELNSRHHLRQHSLHDSVDHILTYAFSSI